jgi:DNA polymerase zeta
MQNERLRHREIQIVDSELDLINATIDVVNDLDPDIVVGWDTQLSSWGYLQARGASYGEYWFYYALKFLFKGFS